LPALPPPQSPPERAKVSAHEMLGIALSRSARGTPVPQMKAKIVKGVSKI